MSKPNPDFDWYSGLSAKFKFSPRCPIASSELCPRYYISRLLLGKTGMSTDFSEEDETKLRDRWNGVSDPELEPSISHIGGNGGERFSSLGAFCPEVTFERFQLFASDLGRYPDEIDVEYAHRQLKKENAEPDDPRWNWAYLIPRHFSECSEFSVYAEAKGIASNRSKTRKRKAISPKVRWQVHAQDNFTCQYCGRKPPEATLQIDHRVSVSDGGSNDINNLVTACERCNNGKGAESLPKAGV